VHTGLGKHGPLSRRLFMPQSESFAAVFKEQSLKRTARTPNTFLPIQMQSPGE